METQTYPKASLLPLHCSNCKEGKAESGGYRVRKHRDIQGIRKVKVLRVRCCKCKGSLGCIYPAGVVRYRWYSSKVEGVFALLDVHRVKEGCAREMAELLGYPLEASTRANWQATRAWRSAYWEDQAKGKGIGVASIDEIKVGSWWVYTLTEQNSQAWIGYAVCSARDEAVVRELVAEDDPHAFISDGCPSIEAACAWFADKPHGRCWFHVIKDL